MTSWADRLELIATGCAVVMVALAALWLLTALIGLFFARNGKKGENGNGDRPSPAPPPIATSEFGIPEHHRVAVAAAVALLMEGRPHRIATIHVPTHRAPVWRRSC